MRSTRLGPFVLTGHILAVSSLISLIGCNAITGLSDFSVSGSGGSAGETGGQGDGGSAGNGTGGGGTGGGVDSDAETTDGSAGSDDGEVADAQSERPPPECVTNQECTDRATQAAASADAGGDAGAADASSDGGVPMVPAVCVQPEGRCVRLLSEDCTTLTGNYLDDSVVVLGSLFTLKGTTAPTNLPRQNSALLAIQEINAAGGIPLGGGKHRPLVMVSCDESAPNLVRAARHLVDLHVPAIVGPNTSQDTIDVSNQVTIAAETVVVTPTAVASSIPDLVDNDLTWLMVPSDVQRAPLMINQINVLETKVHTDNPSRSVKLAIIYRDDALGIGTRTSLNALKLNGKVLSDPINYGSPTGNVRIEKYDGSATDQTPIVTRIRDFAPDIIVLAGTGEAAKFIMSPLEKQWSAADAGVTAHPYYVTIDSVKVPDLITAVTGNDELRKRVRGTGITPGPASVAVYEAFKNDFKLSPFGANNQSVTISGMGPSYDAAYAIGYALAATKDLPVTGPNVAKGLRTLAGGPTTIEVGSQRVLAAFQKLVAGEKITAIGTFGPLDWDSNGAVQGGTLEMWCIGAPTGTPVFQSSGLTFDIKGAGTPSGTYTQCGP